MRACRYRYTLWVPWDAAKLAPQWGGESAAELYAHAGDGSTDMDAWENVNLAGLPAHAQTEAGLRKQLVGFFLNDTHILRGSGPRS
jgi:hypothetical protein